MKTRLHKVWEVRIGSLDDERPRDRLYEGGKRFVKTFRLPERAVYFIEAKGQGAVAKKKALRIALEEGIVNPTVLSLRWSNYRDFYRRELAGEF